MENKLLFVQEENIEKKLNFKLIPYDPIKDTEYELKQLEILEQDMLILSEIMKDFNYAIETQGHNLNEIETEVKETIETFENANIEIKEATGIKTEIISTKLGIATALIIGINAPIGLMLGTKILIGTVLASGALTAMWISKN